jgi:hypothetical protein
MEGRMQNQRAWQQRLNEATTTEDVMWVVRDFLSEWTPGQLQDLPEECRPGRLVDADDVAIYALTLVQKQCADDPAQVLRPVHDMATFFIAASQRISQILAHAAYRTATTNVHI